MTKRVEFSFDLYFGSSKRQNEISSPEDVLNFWEKNGKLPKINQALAQEALCLYTNHQDEVGSAFLEALTKMS